MHGSHDRIRSATRAESGDDDLVARLRRGDEAAFADIVERWSGALLRLALIYCPNRSAAEEVVQETWLGVLKGIDRFEGRSTLKTWVFHILANLAKRRGERERRSIPFSAAWDASEEPHERAVDPERFLGPDHPRWPGHWAVPPNAWADVPEEKLLGDETIAEVARAIASLPPAQREVITLRDVEGWTSVEVCNVLGLTETNQRVLLHRARAKVRRALDQALEADDA